VMQVVQRHGGDIRVRNDGGAVFEVRLPVRRAAAMKP
jgi:signal transduction histidine kinase